MARADLISIACRRGWFNYLHYGIDIGDGTVVHLATDLDGYEWCVQRVSMKSFASGSAVSIEAVIGELPPDDVARRSRKIESFGGTCGMRGGWLCCRWAGWFSGSLGHLGSVGEVCRFGSTTGSSSKLKILRHRFVDRQIAIVDF